MQSPLNECQDIDIVQPKSYKTNLYQHQLSAVKMLETRESNTTFYIQNQEFTLATGDNTSSYEINTNVGIFSDITGYGKTIAIIALLVRDKMYWDPTQLYIHKAYITHYGEGRVLTTDNIKYERIDCNLILMNQSLISQWEDELQKTQLKYTSVVTKKQITACNPNDNDVIIISPTMYNTFMAHYNGRNPFPYAWKRFICDEPQTINISSMKPVMAGYNWFISATPHMLLNKSRNRNNFITNLFHLYMHRNIFDALILKQDDNYVRESYCLPETFHKYHQTYQPLYNIIKGIANDSVTEMIAADNISGAIKLIGGTNLENTDNSNIFELLSGKKKTEIEEIDLKIQLYQNRNDPVKIAKWESKKHTILNQLKNLESRISNILSTECPICTDLATKPVMISGCYHVFCGSCILKWFQTKQTCPLCRNTPNTSDLLHFEQSSGLCHSKTIEQNNTKTKQETIIDLITSKNDGKFIIFSSYDETFDTIRKSLVSENIKYGEIIGKKETRDKVIHDFKHKDVQVLFLNSTNNGAGLNFQEATDIVLYHQMSPELQTQILGRANRIGRKTNLYVHHLN